MRVVAIFLGVIGVVAVCFFGLLYFRSSPSTAELDADIEQVERDIVSTEADAERHAGGLIESLILVRLETQRTAASFLRAKRDALLRRVDLQFIVEGQVRTPNPETIASIEAEIIATELERDRSQLEADRYSGGLIQGIALARVATNELALAQLRMSLLAERYGFLARLPARAAETVAPVGQTVVGANGGAL